MNTSILSRVVVGAQIPAALEEKYAPPPNTAMAAGSFLSGTAESSVLVATKPSAHADSAPRGRARFEGRPHQAYVVITALHFTPQ